MTWLADEPLLIGEDDPSLWENVATGLGAGASAGAVLALVWGVIQAARKLWARTIGRRRAQARVLDQLACGTSVAYIESLLGVAQFTGAADGLDQNTYCLPGAWVLIESRGNEVVSFSITIRARNAWYSTERLTSGNLVVKLGKDTFAKIDQDASVSVNIWTGARRYGALAHLYFGNPGGYQNYWVSHNMAGAGQADMASIYTSYASGEYRRVEKPPPAGQCPDISRTTINTLTVLSPSPGPADREAFMGRDVLGPDHDLLRLAGYWIPSRLSRLRWQLRAWRVRRRSKS